MFLDFTAKTRRLKVSLSESKVPFLIRGEITYDIIVDNFVRSGG